MNEENESVQVLFGQNVKKYRKLAGLNQEQLAERLGVSQKHLSIIETGAQFASASLSRITDFKKYLIFFWTVAIYEGDLCYEKSFLNYFKCDFWDLFICNSAAFSGANKLQLFGYYKDFKWNDEAGCC